MILEKLHDLYPDATVGFRYTSPFKILIATILSAQSTDKQTGPATEYLFQMYPDAGSLAVASVGDVEDRIRSVGLYRSKARYLIESSKILLEEHGGEVPGDMEGLLELPGVGRKTANLVLSKGFGKNVGIAVDTHVHRISRRLGIVRSENRDKVERELTEIFPVEEFLNINTLFIKHGREICKSRGPECPSCGISHLCDYYAEVFPS